LFFITRLLLSLNFKGCMDIVIFNELYYTVAGMIRDDRRFDRSITEFLRAIEEFSTDANTELTM